MNKLVTGYHDMTLDEFIEFGPKFAGGGGGDPGGVESASNISPEQRKALNMVMDWAEGALRSRKAGEVFAGQRVADTPEGFTSAVDRFGSDRFRSLEDQTIEDLIAGKPAYEFNEAAAVDRWRENFANPVLQAWQDTVAPILRESTNLPGTLYSRDASNFVADKAGEFFQSSIAPSLYGTLEQGYGREFASVQAAAAQRPGALSLPFTQFAQSASVYDAVQQKEQNILNAEIARFTEGDPLPYAQLIAGVSTTPTFDNIAIQGTQSPWGQIAASAAGGYFGGPAFAA